MTGGCPQVFFKFLIALLLWSAFGLANASVRSETEIKAAFLYNFTRLITWPQASTPPSALTICVFGRDPFGGVLEQLSGRVSQGRVLELAYPTALEDTDRCQVLFVGSVKTRDLATIVEYAHSRHMLTISEISGFVDKGGIIGYVKEGNVIRFEINFLAAQLAGLRINSRLLELAAKVIR